ncbi:hypothetical protein [Bacillus cereus]|nr:hypothetical protein [Bacillus cereus]HDR8320352.1 hypothetical protein [Bacillus cereus]HDR8328451.1 hypothetical protein [Bacillus cereus]HDR8334214.1 hypothetical protein [Bacillus cereus]
MKKKNKVGKKLLITLGVSVMCLSGCGILPEMDDVASAYEKEKQFVRIKREALQFIIEPTKIKPEDGKISAKTRLAIVNKSKKEIPLKMDDSQILQVIARDENGVKAFERELETDKKVLAPGEELVWDIDMTMLQPSNYTWDVKLLLKSGELPDQEGVIVLYHELQKEWAQSFKWETFEHRFLPTAKQTMAYQVSNGEVMREKFQYFKEGYAQSDDSLLGTKTYFEDSTGLYLVQLQEGEHRLPNQLDSLPKTKTLLVPYPTEKGKTWETDGIKYKIVDTKREVKTKAQTFKDTVIIESLEEPKVRLYYQEGVGLIRNDVYLGGQWVESVSLLAVEK